MTTATAVEETVTLKRQIGLKWPFPIGLVVNRPEVDIHLTSHIPSVSRWCLYDDLLRNNDFVLKNVAGEPGQKYVVEKTIVEIGPPDITS
jgi:hypothetical protein